LLWDRKGTDAFKGTQDRDPQSSSSGLEYFMAAPSINLGDFSNDSISFLNQAQNSSALTPLQSKVKAKPTSMIAGLLDLSIAFLTQQYLSLDSDSL
jgi:hypothetical protein